MKKLYKYLPIILWMGVIFYFSSQVAAESSRQSGAVLHVVRTYVTDVSMFELRKIAHAALYMVLGVLFCALFFKLSWRPKKVAAWAVAGSALYAVTDEFHQLFITGRSSELRDVALDTVGASLGVGLYFLVRRLAKTINHRQQPLGFRRWLSYGLALALVAAYAVSLTSVLGTNIVPSKYLAVAIVLSGLVVTGVLWALWRASWRSYFKSSCLVLAWLIVVLACGYVYSASSTFSQFLTKIVSQQTVYDSYTIVAKKIRLSV
ncbi:VanZ family protein [Candidatus Saccharibacteria bacterium]|nr:MAG: VanZ family protein [Candidatus Saccharibacteria bacterium]